MPPRPWTIARVLRVWMLEVEERKRRIDLALLRSEELVQTLNTDFVLTPAPSVRPLRSDKGIALYVLAVHMLPRLVEDALPMLFGLSDQDMVGDLVFIAGVLAKHKRLVVTPTPVMVSVHDNALYATPIRCAVIGKHLEPGGCESLHLLNNATIGNVAHDSYSIHPLVAVPSKRMLKSFGVVVVRKARSFRVHPDMHIAYYAKFKLRRAARKRSRQCAEHPAAAERAPGRKSANEPPS